MKYAVTLRVDPQALPILKAEFGDLQKERFRVKTSDHVEVEAADATSLLAVMTSIAKVLQVYEQAGTIQ